jgi:3-hydroxyisobutyrate dehydrogenase-like beta-hydroxyacid dehydrogenase
MESRVTPRICLWGLGEVGQTLAPGLLQSGPLVAWDLKFVDGHSAPSRAARELGLQVSGEPPALGQVDLVISAVTAAQILDAARTAAPRLQRGAWFLDLNSTSPGAKQQAAQVIDAAGGRFVEAAIMSPIAPKGAASPMLLGGPHAAAFQPLAHSLGFTGAEVVSGKLGTASAAKMCRSVMIKGMEALLIESMLSARHYGVERAVLESLRGLFPQDWRHTGRYMISRALIHGERRAEEMREAARTVEDAGLSPRMSSACAEWQSWAARRRAAETQPQLEGMLDALLAERGP